MNERTNEVKALLSEIAKAICCVQINGGDPNQPAMRWNGVEMEPQEFPVWKDYLDEATAAMQAFINAGKAI